MGNDDALAALEAEAVAGRLAAGLAHDLGHLLTTLGLNLEVFARHSPEGAARERALALRASLDDAAGLLGQLVEVARGPQASPRPDPGGDVPAAPVDDVVAGLAPLLRPALGAVDLELELDAGGVVAALPPLELRRCLLNLALNAAAALAAGATDARATVTLRTATTTLAGDEADVWPRGRQGRFALVEVADNGPGLDPAVVRQLVEAYEGAAPRGPSAAAAGSLGLGLRTTLALVAGCGGAMSLVSRPGAGCVAGLRLPIVEGR